MTAVAVKVFDIDWTLKSGIHGDRGGSVAIGVAESLRPQDPIAVDERHGESRDALLGHELRDSRLVPRDHGGRIRIRRR